MSRRKQPTQLTRPEVERLMQAAMELHRACCGPIITPSGAHSRVLTELNQAIIVAIEAITGDKAPWMKTPPAYLHPGIKRAASAPPKE
jgi:hypothetical protein